MSPAPAPGLWQGLRRGLCSAPAWPRRCALCLGWARADLCGACGPTWGSDTTRCPRCGLRDPGRAPACGQCQRRPPPVARTVVALDYAPPWDGLIQRLKFGEELALAAVLARQLARAVRAQRDLPAVDWVLPVPLHPQRLRQRGYNQAWLVAREVARQLAHPSLPDGLLRWRSTDAQAQLDRPQRSLNVQAAFMVNPAQRQRLRGCTVAVVDDVMTTGATAFAAAGALREAGVQAVQLWVVARTPEPEPPEPPNGGLAATAS